MNRSPVLSALSFLLLFGYGVFADSGLYVLQAHAQSAVQSPASETQRALAEIQSPASETQRALAEIRKEGFENSQIMEIVHHLTDEFGPRLTGSPSLERAGNWALEFLTGIGLENARTENWDWGHPGWENNHLDVHMIAPVAEPLIAEVLAWTPGTRGTVRADVVRIVLPLEPTFRELDDYLDGVRNDIRGKIVFVGRGGVEANAEQAATPELSRLAASDQSRSAAPDRSRSAKSESGILDSRAIDQRVADFLLENGALVRVNSSGMPDGLIRAFGNRKYDSATAVPTIILRTEDYGRISRLIDREVSVRLEIVIENEEYPAGETVYNFLADISGSDLSDEIVMLGGHLDSWHAATGATDNAAGSAVMIEAVRILKALDLSPRRTIRIALWSGEEQGLLGSQSYVSQHYGSFENPRSDFQGFSGYVNVDTGTGRLRSATVFGPDAAATMLSKMFVPLKDVGMGVATATANRTVGGSDHTSFNQAGLPGISMKQDPVRYRSHTWHTNLDTFEQLLPEELKQAAVVVASTIYQLATVDEKLPRFDSETMPEVPASR